MPRISDILRYAALLIVIIVVVLFVTSQMRKRREYNALLSEMRSVVSESSYYRQFYEADARQTLLRAMHILNQAEQRGQDPSRFLNEVLGVAGDSWFDRSDDRRSTVTRAQSLAEETLRANYEHCRKLGLLDDKDSLDDLAKGELPVIRSGPSAGQRAAVVTVIDAELSPGIEKVLANLQIAPPRDPSRTIGDVEIAAARRLARDLEDAHIIEQEATNRILARYDALAPK